MCMSNCRGQRIYTAAKMQSRMSHQLAVTWKRLCGTEPKQLSGGRLMAWPSDRPSGGWRIACSGNVLCVQFTRSPMRMVVKSGAGPDSQTGCLCAATIRARCQMAATCNMHRFQCRHQAGHRFRGADLCTRASRGYTVLTKRLARGKQCASLRHSCASSDAADVQLANMVRIVFEWACTFNATVDTFNGFRDCLS